MHPKSPSPFWILYLLLLFSLSCQKPVDGVLPEAPPAPQYVTTTLKGRIVDENAIPVADATVKAGSQVSTTDLNGEFLFTNVQVDKGQTFVKAEKSGYFTGSRTLITKENRTSSITIELITKETIGNVSAAGGGTVPLPAGGSISLPANGVVNALTKTAYNGNVEVAAFFIDPTADNFNNIMPGDLRGITTTNEERGLQSFGMLAVELSGGSGEKLQLAEGKKSTLVFPIPAGLLSTAPATIPLWYFDEEKGLWKEEGVATKNGNQYTGTVGHFSFWNCDAPFPLVDLEARIKDGNGQPMAFCQVVINTAEDKMSRFGYGVTDAEGYVYGKVPNDKSLVITVYNKCNAVVYTKNIGVQSSKASLGTITVNNPVPAAITFTGTVKDCNAAPVTNGFANVSINGSNYRTAITNGNFSLTITSCDGNVGQAFMYAYDMGSGKTSDSTVISFNGNTAPPVNLTTCSNTAMAYINYTLNGKEYALVAPVDSLTAYNKTTGMTVIMGSIYNYNPGERQSINFNFMGTTTGTFPLLDLYLEDKTKYYSKKGSLNVNITQYDVNGGFIAGSFSGNVSDSVNTVPISCTFKVRY